jgi:ankyrin repeat protein
MLPHFSILGRTYISSLGLAGKPQISSLRLSLTDDLVAHSTAQSAFLKSYLLADSSKRSISQKLRDKFDWEEIPDEQGLTSLHRTILSLTKRDFGVEILEHPELVNIPDAMGRTPLWWATQIGNVAYSKILLNFGADPQEADLEKYTPLHNATKHDKGLVELLLDAGANVNAKNFIGMTPLHRACITTNNVNVVRLLLNRGADLEASDYRKRNPLFHCSWVDHDDVAELLLQRGANQYVVDVDGDSIWYVAMVTCASRVLQALVRHGCRPLTARHESGSGLCLATRFGNAQIALVLKKALICHIDTNDIDDYRVPFEDTLEGDLEERYSRHELFGWPPCSSEDYYALKDLISLARSTNRRALANSCED